MNQERQEHWVPWALFIGVFAILLAHGVPWLQMPITARSFRAQQHFLEKLVDYERSLTLFDDTLRAKVLDPDRRDLEDRKRGITHQIRGQLEALVEAAPSEGKIVPALLDLASHWKGKVLPESAAVEAQARAPGEWASLTFRVDYARARSGHAQRIREIADQAKLMAEGAFESGQRQLFLSAGVCLLLWSSTLTGLVIRQHQRSRNDRLRRDAESVGDADTPIDEIAPTPAPAIPHPEGRAPSAAAAPTVKPLSTSDKPLSSPRAQAAGAANLIPQATPDAPAAAPSPVALAASSVPAAEPLPAPSPASAGPAPSAVGDSMPERIPISKIAGEPAGVVDSRSSDDSAKLLSGEPAPSGMFQSTSEPEKVASSPTKLTDDASVEAMLKAVEQQEATIPISKPSSSVSSSSSPAVPVAPGLVKSQGAEPELVRGSAVVMPNSHSSGPVADTAGGVAGILITSQPEVALGPSVASTLAAEAVSAPVPEPDSPSMVEMASRGPAITTAAALSVTPSSSAPSAGVLPDPQPAGVRGAMGRGTEPAGAPVEAKTIRGSDIQLAAQGAPAGPLDLSF